MLCEAQNEWKYRSVGVNGAPCPERELWPFLVRGKICVCGGLMRVYERIEYGEMYVARERMCGACEYDENSLWSIERMYSERIKFFCKIFVKVDE